ncbi:MAG TPA: hypothetical protein VGQ62_08555 [Chloroflexota bacterium]|jgi:hypothetical protein|nr:hypothetical protein [Chloroflexota bacterium]
MTTPLGALVRGTAAGGAGTLAMDLVWFSRYKRGGGEQSFSDWEFSVGLADWSKASAPAHVGKRLYEALFQRPLDAKYAALTNNVMHWAYGSGWGALYAMVTGPRPHLLSGVPFGAFVWGMSYVILPLMGLYKPIWEYDPPTLWKDLSAHLVYGSVTTTTMRVLSMGCER